MPITWFEIRESAGVAREGEPFRIGVPFARGCLRDTAALAVSSAGKAEVMAIRSLATWGDGSVKWALFEGIATLDGGETRRYQVDLAARGAGETPGALPLPGFAPPAVGYDADTFCLPLGPETLRARLVCRDGTGASVPVRITGRGDFGGSLSCRVRLTGEIGTATPCRFSVDLCYAGGLPRVVLDFTLHNPNPALHRGGIWDLGDEGGALLREVSLELAAEGFPAFALAEDPVQGRELLHGQNSVRIYQDSSGGENWQSENHVTRDGSRATSFQGYRVEIDGEERGRGLRAQPHAMLLRGELAVVAALQDFWQNFPKAISVAEGKMVISFLPADSVAQHELQGGERKRHRVVAGLADRTRARSVAVLASAPLQAVLDPGHVAATGAVRHLATSAASPLFDRLADCCLEGPDSLESRREIIDEYGWRNFGDCYADHEVLEGSFERPFVTHYNNQYDLIFSFLRRYLKKGEPRWFGYAHDLARHVLDVDIYHTDGDRSTYCHGLFWHTQHFLPAATATHRCFSARHGKGGGYGGGPSSEHCYAGGLLHYYYLTGESVAAEAVEKLGNLIIHDVMVPRLAVERLENLARAALQRLKRSRQRGAPPLKPYRYEGPGRGSGNALHVLLDAFLLTGADRYLRCAARLVCQCVAPDEEIARRELLNAEFRWSYTIFLQAMIRFIEISRDYGRFPKTRAYARCTLLHYARWMAENEYPFLDRPELLDAPNFATRSAQDLRKACIFLEAAAYAGGADADSFRARAEEFLERSCRDLSSFDTARTMRPLAIVLQNMDTLAWHRSGKGEAPREPDDSFQGVEEELRRRFAAESGRSFVTPPSCPRLGQEISYLRRRFKEVF